mgnify:FL=1|jgi:flagellar hook-length control protein FliK
MEVSTSSSQRSPETELLRRNETARLSKGAIDDAFSRHLNETRQEAKADQRSVSAAESRAEEAREARRADDKRSENSRAESQAEHQRAEKRRDEEARAKRADEKASEKAAAAREKDAPEKPAEETSGEEADLAAGFVETAPASTDNAETAVVQTGEKTAETGANAAETAPIIDGEADAQAAQTGTGKETGTQNTAAADAAKNTQNAAATGLNTAAAAAAQSAAQGTSQTANTQSSRAAAPDLNAAAATDGAGDGPNAALQAAQAAADADLSGNLADDGALAGKDGKTLGQLAADKLSAGKEGTAAEFKVTGAEATAQRTPPAAAATAPQQAAPINLAGFGLVGTEKPLNVTFDSTSGLQIEGLPTGTSTQNTNPVQLRFGALPGQAQATQVPASAIALQIAKHVQKGVNTFEIRIDPPELGRVDVKLDVAADGRATAHLVVEKAETLDLLQRDAKALQQALQDAGLEADQDTLSFSLKDEGQAGTFGEGQGQREGEAGGTGEAGLAESEQPEVITSYRVMLNGETGVDIRV